MSKASELSEYKERLKAYKQAELAILDGGQNYKIGTKSFTRADLTEVASMIKYLEKRISELEIAVKTGTTKRKTVRALIRDI